MARETEPAVVLPAGTVTFLLTDVAGSTRLWESDREAMGRSIARHYDIIDEAVAKHGGARPVEQGEGDSTVSAFTRATDAVGMALDVQRALAAEEWPAGAPIRVRIGIHTGEAHLRDDGNYAGPALNRCARLRSIGHGGQMLLSRTTADLVRDELPADVSLADLGEHPLRDLDRPEHVYQLCHSGLASDFPALTSPRSSRSALPAQVTSFIGREQEIAEVVRLLEETRLLTLVGSGGCGKTRLAIEAIAGIMDRYRDGVVWVDLSSLSDPSLVASAVATELTVRETLMQDLTDTIAAHLKHRQMLLLLDNCEHLAAACASFADRTLRACPEVSILATSREPFGVQAETAWRVPSLTLPSAGEAQEAESVQLFLERARKARPHFRVTDETVHAIETICRRLDGIPLAIELAAARVRTMSAEQIAKGIGDRFSLLSGSSRTALARQRTLEASVDWSYNLLSEPERILFSRLAIFSGGFTLEAAERVCAGAGVDEYAVLDVLSQLVDRSLVQLEEANVDTRYRMLETVRVYARQKLADSGDVSAIRTRHLAYFVEFVERAERGLETAEAVPWGDRLEGDHDNVRAAIDSSVDIGDTHWALRLGAALLPFWLYHGHLPEGRRRLDAILSLEGGDAGLRARALASAAGVATHLLDDPAGTRAFAEQALALARGLDDAETIARASTFLGFTALYGDAAKGREARDFLEQGAASLGRSRGTYVTTALTGLMLTESILGERDRARDAARRAVEMARSTGHPFQQAQALGFAGWRAAYWGEFEEARRCFDESVAIGREIRDHFFLSFALCGRGWVEVYCGRYEESRRDLEESMKIARPVGLFVIIGFCDMFSAERCYAEGDLDAGVVAVEEALAIFGVAEFSYGVAWGLAVEALIKEAQHERDASRLLAQEALAIARPNGHPREHGRALLVLARLDHRAGSIDRAEHAAHEALDILLGSHLSLEMVTALEQIAAIAIVKESFEEGARLIGAAQAARDAIGYPVPPIRRDEQQAAITSLRETLGPEAFDAAWSEGAALSLDDAVAYATRARGERRRPSHGWESLTPTELQVVGLVREGLTNPGIAKRLFISARTVQTHVAHIFAKLGVKTRAELASEATRRGV